MIASHDAITLTVEGACRGDGDTQVELPTLRTIIGTPLPRAAYAMLQENLDALIAAWNALNAERSI